MSIVLCDVFVCFFYAFSSRYNLGNFFLCSVFFPLVFDLSCKAVVCSALSWEIIEVVMEVKFPLI